MDNNRNYPDSFFNGQHNFNYGQYNEYQDYSNATSSRNENLLPRESYLKSSNGNKPYYRGQDNFQNSYSENQLWDMQARRVPNSSYSMFPSPHKQQNSNQSVVDSRMRNKLSQKRDLQLNGIINGEHNGNNLEGMYRNIISEKGMANERTDAIQRRANIPQSNYRLPSNRSNENSILTLCGGEPIIDLDDSQYYLINDRKLEPENYGIDKNLYDDGYTDEGDEELMFQDYYNSMDIDMYEPSLQDVAAFDARERVNKPLQIQMQSNNHSEKLDGPSYDNDNNGDHYMFQQQNAPSSSQGNNQNRQQILNRSRNLIHPSVSRQEMYKQMVSEKLNETFNELKNAGFNDKTDQGKSQRNESLSGMERYKYQDLINDNSKISAMMSHLNKYKGGSDNEQISKRLQFPLSKTKDVSRNTNRNIQMYPEEQKFSQSSSLGLSGSFVHKHKEYQNSSSVPGCCVDVFNNYRKEKFPDSMSNTQ